MTVATLAEVLQPALKHGYAVGGLVCLGWEDMRAYVAAAEAENAPVILQAGPSCREHTPLPVLGAMMRHLAENASVPVVLHLDHGYTFEECQEARDSGFTSLMFDGSRKPLGREHRRDSADSQIAHRAGISCEGEIGFVGYDGGEASAGTDPQEAAQFARETGVDAMAISVGNVHLQQESMMGWTKSASAPSRHWEHAIGHPWRLRRACGAAHAPGDNIENLQVQHRHRAAHGVRSGAAPPSNADPDRFDRVQILKETHDPVEQAARAGRSGLFLHHLRETN
jgi:fructose-bisphosphate aldolase class II